MSIFEGCISDYWDGIDDKLQKLKQDGFVKLPTLKNYIDLNSLASEIKHDMNGATFAELGASHNNFLNNIKLDSILAPKLYKIAKENFGYNGSLDNQYHIARKVEPGNSKEMYRAHFDSHLFTIVFPIKIPRSSKSSPAGELIYFPNARNHTNNEVKNFFEKLYFKKYASKKGLDKFAINKEGFVENFNDYSPLLFIGNTTLHTNKQVSVDCSSYRLTLLAHFFDPSPKYGVGNLLRLVRGR